MANIEINNLGPAGSELFNDSESFLNELNDREMWGVQGGITVDTLSATLGETVGGLTAGSAGGTLGETVTGLTAGTLGGLSITGPV